MDIRMPYMNGYEATKIIRKLQGYESNKIPIIAMTADAFDEDIKKTKKAGMDDFLSKPIQPAALISALRKNIQK
jgi:CheY-like chemotaxis protein